MEERTRLQAISLLKIVCMFLVILGHSCVAYTGIRWGGVCTLQPSKAMLLLFCFLGMVHTQAFTFASGYLFSYNRYTLGRYRNGKKDIIKRFNRLLIPYIFFPLFWGIPGAIIFEKTSFVDLIKTFGGGTNPAQYWFLLMLFEVYLAFYLFGDFIIKIPSWITIAGMFSLHYFANIASNHFPLGYFGVANTLRYILFFYVGIWAEQHKFLHYRPMALFVAILITTTLYTIYLKVNVLQVFLRPFIGIAGVEILVNICCYLASKTNLSHNRLYVKYATSSMGVYLLHQQIIYAILRYTAEMTAILGTCINFGISFAVSMAITNLIRRGKFGRYILGEKI